MITLLGMHVPFSLADPFPWSRSLSLVDFVLGVIQEGVFTFYIIILDIHLLFDVTLLDPPGFARLNGTGHKWYSRHIACLA